MLYRMQKISRKRGSGMKKLVAMGGLSVPIPYLLPIHLLAGMKTNNGSRFLACGGPENEAARTRLTPQLPQGGSRVTLVASKPASSGSGLWFAEGGNSKM